MVPDQHNAADDYDFEERTVAALQQVPIVPSRRFYHRMSGAPWVSGNVQTGRASAKAQPGRTRRHFIAAFVAAAGLVVLLVALLWLPTRLSQPLEPTAGSSSTADAPATVIPNDTPVATALPTLEGALFIADGGDVVQEGPDSIINAPPQVVAWQPGQAEPLWTTEVGLGPQLAVDVAGRYVFVLSQYRNGEEHLTGLRFNPQALFPPSADWPKRVTVIEAATGHVAWTVTLPEAPRASQGELWVKPVGVIGNRLYVYLLSSDDSLAAIDLETRAVLPERWTLCGAGFPRSVKLAVNDHTLYALCSPNLGVSTGVDQPAWWVQITQLGAAVPTSQRVQMPFPGFATRGEPLLLTADGNELYFAASQRGQIAKIDTVTAQVAQQARYHTEPQGCQCEAVLSLSADGSSVYVATAGTETTPALVEILDANSLQVTTRLEVPASGVSPLRPLLLTPETGHLYVRTENGLAAFGIESRTITQLLEDIVYRPNQIVAFPAAALTTEAGPHTPLSMRTRFHP